MIFSKMSNLWGQQKRSCSGRSSCIQQEQELPLWKNKKFLTFNSMVRITCSTVELNRKKTSTDRNYRSSIWGCFYISNPEIAVMFGNFVKFSFFDKIAAP